MNRAVDQLSAAAAEIRATVTIPPGIRVEVDPSARGVLVHDGELGFGVSLNAIEDGIYLQQVRETLAVFLGLSREDRIRIVRRYDGAEVSRALKAMGR